MEGNRDESEKCLHRAEIFLKGGNIDQALKYINKAERLYPSKRAKDLLADINSSKGSAASEGECESEASAAASSEAPDRGSPGADGKEKDRTKCKHASADSYSHEVQPKYTKEQLEAVRTVLKHKDYYEILGLTRTCTDDDLKRAYKKLALRFHPDKNHAPGATEAFKAISKAFSILNDPDKRRRYDEVGVEDDRPSPRNRHGGRYGSDSYDYDTNFDDDVFADELFRMFFGGGFQRANTRSRQANRRHHTNSRSNHQSAQGEQQSESSYSLLLQISPLVFLMALSLISTLLIGDPPYSLQQNSKFTNERTTERLTVRYFVKGDFLSYYADSISSIERQVEEEYLRNLEQNCYRERVHRENNMWRARMYNNEQLYQQAKNIKTPSCDRLTQIRVGR